MFFENYNQEEAFEALEAKDVAAIFIVNEEFDNLLLKAAQAKESERYGYLAEAENILLDSGMVLPLYHPVSFNIIDLKEVGGWSANAFNIHPLKYLFKKVENVKLQNVVLK